MNLTYNCRTK